MSCSGWLDDRREYSTKMTRDASRSTLNGTGKLQFNRPGLDCSISSADLSAWNDFVRFLKVIPPRGFFFQSRHHCVCCTPCTALWRNPEHWPLICIELTVHFPESESRERFGMSKPRSALFYGPMIGGMRRRKVDRGVVTRYASGPNRWYVKLRVTWHSAAAISTGVVPVSSCSTLTIPQL